MMPVTTKSSRFATVGGVRMHYLDFGGSGPVLLFVHGGQDHAHTWDFIAPAFTDSHRVFAVDLRGHGDSDWVSGGLYTALEHVIDLAGLGASLSSEPLRLVGHSFGSTVCLRWAGLQPSRVEMVAAIEGFGPPPTHPSQVLPRAEYLRDWVNVRVRQDSGAGRRTYATVDEAARRIREVNPRLSPELAGHLAAHGTRRQADGGLTWKFDPAVRQWAPYGLDRHEAVEIYSLVTCRVLILRGLDSWVADPAANPLVQALPRRAVVDVASAGHWVHHDQAEHVITTLRAWLRGPESTVKSSARLSGAPRQQFHGPSVRVATPLAREANDPNTKDILQ